MSDIKYEIVKKIGIARTCNWVDGGGNQDCGRHSVGARQCAQETRCGGVRGLWLAVDLSDDEILARLLALNLERAS
jgi:hypothetical protein